MLDTTLTLIKNQLDQYLKNRFALQEDMVVLGNLVNEKEALIPQHQDKIVFTLLQMEEDSSLQKNNFPGSRTPDGSVEKQLSRHFNIDILLSAVFKDYVEALRFLSATLSFFQAKSIFNPVNLPELPANIVRITVEQIKTNHADRYHLWAALGCRQLPFLLFRFRLQSLEEAPVSAITGTQLA